MEDVRLVTSFGGQLIGVVCPSKIVADIEAQRGIDGHILLKLCVSQHR